MTDAVEASGRTVEEAIDKALEMLGATDDEVEIQILAEGVSGGLLRRGDDARVRVKLRDERTPEDLAELEELEDYDEGYEPEGAPADHRDLAAQAQAAEGFLRGLIEILGVEADVVSSLGREGALVDLEGRDLGLLIGRRGSTLDALQEVTRGAVQREVGERAWVNLDIEGYRARRRGMLERRARSVAAKVRRSGRAEALEPMSAFERKVIHDALTRFDGVSTSSEGEDPNRYVVISPAGR